MMGVLRKLVPLISLLLLCCGCSSQVITDNLPLSQDMAGDEGLTEEQLSLLENVQTYISNMGKLTSYSSVTTATSEIILPSENHRVSKTVHITSQQRVINQLLQIKQVTDEFIYTNDRLISKDSWASYRKGSTLAVENGDRRYKWESSLNNANINYANRGDLMITPVEDNVGNITMENNGSRQVYTITLKEGELKYNIEPMGIDGYDTDAITSAKLRLYVNPDTGLIEEAIFLTELIVDDAVKTADGLIHSSQLPWYNNLPTTTVVITEETDTVFGSINNTVFDMPDLGLFTDGSPQSFAS